MNAAGISIPIVATAVPKTPATYDETPNAAAA
jgi:hypothetical protein